MGVLPGLVDVRNGRLNQPKITFLTGIKLEGLNFHGGIKPLKKCWVVSSKTPDFFFSGEDD